MIQASPPRKERPTTSRTLRRNKSAFEYYKSSSRGRGSRSSSRGRSSGRSSNRSNQSSVGINFSFNLSGTRISFPIIIYVLDQLNDINILLFFQMVQQVVIFHFFRGQITYRRFFRHTCLIGLMLYVRETVDLQLLPSQN